MPEEIERKFLVKDDSWKALGEALALRQGYLSISPERTVRVRQAADRGWITVKGPTRDYTRSEFEYEIPGSDAQEMLDSLCLRPILEKRRTKISHAGLTWEVDEFLGDNAGLIVAEVELSSATQDFDRPVWIGTEVTGDPRFYNSNLLKNPYSHWKETV